MPKYYAIKIITTHVVVYSLRKEEESLTRISVKYFPLQHI
jgi:hypothetical protein